MLDHYINKIYGEEIEFLNGYESFCYQNCQKIVLKAQGYSYPELYVNSSISLLFNKKGKTIYTHDNVRSLLPSIDGYTKRIRYENTSNEYDIFNENANYISSNNDVIIVGVDSYYLQYASNYKKNHARHTLILCGYDLFLNVVYVIDWYVPWFYKGTIPLDVFLQSRNSKNEYDGSLYSGKSIDNNWAKIDRFPPRKSEELFLELIEVTINNSIDINEFEVSSCNAITELGNYVLSCNDPNLLLSFNKKFKLITKRYNLFMESLISFNNLNKSLYIDNCIDLLQKMTENWDILQMQIYKKAINNNERINHKIEYKLNEIYQNEFEFQKMIKEIKKKIQ